MKNKQLNPAAQFSADLFMTAEERRKAENLTEAEKLTVAVSGFEGPIDALLALARAQKVDLRDISVSNLADQYIRFIKEAKNLRMELAADYLVTAAWLAYLKSYLMLPVTEIAEDEPCPEEMARRLQFQLARLDAFRKATERLFDLPKKNEDFFARGEPQFFADKTEIKYSATIYDLLSVYGEQKVRNFRRTYRPRPPEVFTPEQALKRLQKIVGATPGWSSLSRFMPDFEKMAPVKRRSYIASSFVACLEMVKIGALEIRQKEAFAELEIRSLSSE